MVRVLEQKIYYHYQTSSDEIGRKDLRVEEAEIIGANYGRHPTPGPFTRECPVGLNINIVCGPWNYGATYTVREDIRGLMDDLGAEGNYHPEKIIGKKVLAHLKGRKLIGLSVPKE